MAKQGRHFHAGIFPNAEGRHRRNLLPARASTARRSLPFSRPTSATSRSSRTVLQGGNVIPADFQPTPGGLRTRAAEHHQVRPRRSARRQRFHRRHRHRPAAGNRSADRQETRLRQGRRRAREQHPRQIPDPTTISVHIIGFAKVIGDITRRRARRAAFLRHRDRDLRRAAVLFFAVADAHHSPAGHVRPAPSSGSSGCSISSASASIRCRSSCRFSCSPSR